MAPRKAIPTYTPETTFSETPGEPNEQPAATHETQTPTDDLGEKPESIRERLLRLYHDNTGLLLICASQFFYSCMNTSVQLLNRVGTPIPSTEILFIRMSVTWGLTVAYMYCKGISHPISGPPGVRPLLVIRGICGFLAVFGMYFSLQYLSLSDATVLTFLSPFVTSFTGTFFLGEKFSHRNLLSGLVSLVGVVLIARPDALLAPLQPKGSDSAERGTSQQRLLAVGVAMVGVFGLSGAYTSIRAIGKRAHTLHNVTYYALLTTIISAGLTVFGVFDIVTPSRRQWGLIVLISFFGFAFQFLMISGFRRETASRGSLGMYMQIVFAWILERVFFRTKPSTLSIIGTAIILSCAIYVGLTKVKEEKSGGESQDGCRTLPGDCTIENPGDGQRRFSHAVDERTPLLREGITVPEIVVHYEQDKKVDVVSHV